MVTSPERRRAMAWFSTVVGQLAGCAWRECKRWSWILGGGGKVVSLESLTHEGDEGRGATAAGGHSLGDQAVVDQGLVDLRPQFRVEGGHCVVGGRRWYLDGCRRVLARHDVKKPRVGWWRALRRRARCKAEEAAWR